MATITYLGPGIFSVLEFWHSVLHGLQPSTGRSKYGSTSGSYLSRSASSIKVIWPRSGSIFAKCSFCSMDFSLTWFYLSKVKVINWIKVIWRSRSFQGQIASVWFSFGKRGVGPSTERHSCCFVFLNFIFLVYCFLQRSLFHSYRLYLY